MNSLISKHGTDEHLAEGGRYNAVGQKRGAMPVSSTEPTQVIKYLPFWVVSMTWMSIAALCVIYWWLSGRIEMGENQVHITVSGDYDEYAGIARHATLQYPFLRNATLLEPHRSNHITVGGISSDAQCLVTWRLESDTASRMLIYDGILELENTFSVTPEATGRYSLTIIRTCTASLRKQTPQATTDTTYEFPVWVKYVRRSLTSLTDTDRDEYLDALHILAAVDTHQGRPIYGDQYRSLHYFAGIVVANSTNSVGAGVLGYLGVHVEQSLQLVNPRVALHYIDPYCVPLGTARLLQQLAEVVGRGALEQDLSRKAVDALPWAVLSGLERLSQRTGGDSVRGSADGQQAWLAGFQFEDRSVRAESLTAAQLAEILRPASALYRDYLSYIYDSAELAACPAL